MLTKRKASISCRASKYQKFYKDFRSTNWPGMPRILFIWRAPDHKDIFAKIMKTMEISSKVSLPHWTTDLISRGTQYTAKRLRETPNSSPLHRPGHNTDCRTTSIRMKALDMNGPVQSPESLSAHEYLYVLRSLLHRCRPSLSPPTWPEPVCRGPEPQCMWESKGIYVKVGEMGSRGGDLGGVV